MEHFYRFVKTTRFWFFINNEINVNICMDKVTISGSSDCPLNTHQAVLLAPAEHRPWVHDGPVLVLGVGSDPTNVFASPEAPVLQTQSPKIQSITAATPEKHKTSAGTHFTCNKVDINIIIICIFNNLTT